jgi:hypothetical protein
VASGTDAELADEPKLTRHAARLPVHWNPKRTRPVGDTHEVKDSIKSSFMGASGDHPITVRRLRLAGSGLSAIRLV